MKITAAAKTVAVTVQGSAGSEYYVTNIRCLRDLTEMIDNVSAKITTEANRITAEVNSKFKNYPTTEEINSKIEVAQKSILLNVSQNYTTTDQSKRLYQDAVNNTTTQLQNYVSTASLEAKLKVEADSIKSSVKADIATSYVSKDNLKEQLTSYATTAQVQSAINQQASSITAEVKRIYRRHTLPRAMLTYGSRTQRRLGKVLQILQNPGQSAPPHKMQRARRTKLCRMPTVLQTESCRTTQR